MKWETKPFLFSFFFFPILSIYKRLLSCNLQAKLTRPVVTTVNKKTDFTYNNLLYQADIFIFTSIFSSHTLDHLPTTVCPFIAGSSILLYFFAMVCVALSSYQFISQPSRLNSCQHSCFCYKLWKSWKLRQRHFFFSFYAVSLPDGWHYFEQSSFQFWNYLVWQWLLFHIFGVYKLDLCPV